MDLSDGKKKTTHQPFAFCFGRRCDKQVWPRSLVLALEGRTATLLIGEAHPG